MVLSQWSPTDTCMCPLSKVLGIDVNWIAAWTPHQLARLARTHSALIWPSARTETVERLVLSQWWQHDTCMCDLCLVLAIRVIDIWTGLLNQCPINWQDRKDIEPWFFQHGKICSILGSFLLGTGTGNVIPGNEWIPGSRQKTASATKGSSWHKVCGVCQTQALPTFNIAKDTLFIDLTLCENGNFGENVSTCVPFQQYWWWIWTG